MDASKWHEVFTGEEERVFFVGRDGRGGLVRSQYDFRSVEALAEETGLSVERVREIIAKHLQTGVIVPSPNRTDSFGYSHRINWRRA